MLYICCYSYIQTVCTFGQTVYVCKTIYGLLGTVCTCSCWGSKLGLAGVTPCCCKTSLLAPDSPVEPAGAGVAAGGLRWGALLADTGAWGGMLEIRRAESAGLWVALTGSAVSQASCCKNTRRASDATLTACLKIDYCISITIFETLSCI